MEDKESLATASNNITVEYCQGIVDNASFVNLMKRYESFFHDVIDGKYGSTAAYWAIYVYLINRVYRELKRAVRTNDVDGYIHILPSIIEVCFALNRPNYSRWGSLFLHKLQQMDPRAREILEAGAMSIRRTKKSYARSAVDLTLEQTVKDMLHLQREALLLSGTQKMLAGGGVSPSLNEAWPCQSSMNWSTFNQGRNLKNSLRNQGLGVTMLT